MFTDQDIKVGHLGKVQIIFIYAAAGLSREQLRKIAAVSMTEGSMLNEGTMKDV